MEKTEEPVPTHLAIMWSGKKELRMVSEMNNISLSEFIRSSVERIAPKKWDLDVWLLFLIQGTLPELVSEFADISRRKYR